MVGFSGLFVYFYYGIKNSTLEPRVDEDERIELKMKPQTKPANRPRQVTTPAATTTARVATAATTVTPTAANTSTAVIDEKTERKRPTNLEPIPANNDSNLFVSPSAFPKWED